MVTSSLNYQIPVSFSAYKLYTPRQIKEGVESQKLFLIPPNPFSIDMETQNGSY